MIRVQQAQWTSQAGWSAPPPELDAQVQQIAFAFGARELLSDPACIAALGRAFPPGSVVGCTTGGEIQGTSVSDGCLSVTSVRFEHTQVRVARVSLAHRAHSRASGRAIARDLMGEGLACVCVLSDGLLVNGSELVSGLREVLPSGVVVTGGLAADGQRFEETLVLSFGVATSKVIVAVGLYGARLQVGTGSLGGWDPFGPERRITRASGNVLFELDGKSALGLYRRYLGHHAESLPSSAQLFPLCVRRSRGDIPIVRGILSIDEETESMTFAGDVPEGGCAQLMRANVDRLVDGALGAARSALQGGAEAPELALLISCTGRRLVMRQRTEEEVEAVREVLGAHTVLAGFYANGEIAPVMQGGACELHNQTMTLATFSET